MLSDNSSFPQLIVTHSEHKMDVIKVEPNSDSEDVIASPSRASQYKCGCSASCFTWVYS